MKPSQVIVAFLLFIFVYAAHSRSTVITSTDSMWSIFLAKSLIVDGDISLNEYRPVIKERNKYGLRKRRGQFYNYFPPGTALMATPFVWMFERFPEAFAPLVPGIERQEGTAGYPSAEQVYKPLERAIASLVIALTTVLLLFFLSTFCDFWLALLFSILFAFASPAWSIASRGLWQHGPNMLMMVTGLMLFSSKNVWLSALSGLPLSFSYIIRPTGAISAAIAGVLGTLKLRRFGAAFVLSSSLVIAPFVLFNLDYFGRPIPSYYNTSRLTFGPTMPEALLANLFSPSRGLFVFCMFLLPPLCFLRLNKWREMPPFIHAALIITVLNWIAVSAFPNWWGGHAFGPRYMTDVVPLLIIVAAWVTHRSDKKKLILPFVFLLGFMNFINHYQGANSQQLWGWNIEGTNIDDRPEKVWRLRSSQFLLSIKFTFRDLGMFN